MSTAALVGDVTLTFYRPQMTLPVAFSQFSHILTATRSAYSQKLAVFACYVHVYLSRVLGVVVVQRHFDS